MILDTLIESALRSLVLALAVGLGLWIARTRSARLQMTAWTLVLAGALLMPFLMHWHTVEIHPPRRVAVAAPVVIRTVIAPRIAFRPAPAARQIPWRAIGLGVYAGIAAVLLLRLLMGLWLTWILWRRSRRVREPWVAAQDVRESADIVAPATFGSSILLPVTWREWDEPKLGAVIAHERAHVAWGDFYVQLAGRVHVAVFWFSPMAWWLENRLIHLAEAASDDAALETGAGPSSYAEILLGLMRKEEHASAAVAMARPATVRRRVERILSGVRLPANPSWKRYVQVGAMVVAVVALVAGSSIRAQQEPALSSAPTKSAPAVAAQSGEIEIHEDALIQKKGDAWAIVSDDKTTIGGSHIEKDAEKRARSFRDRISGGYVWFRRDGKEYLITDPETVKRAEEIFQQQKAQAETAYGVAIMARLAEQQALLAKTDDEAGQQLPLVIAELQAVHASQQRLREQRGAGREQLRKIEDELRLAKEKELSPETLHHLEESVSQAQANLSGDLAREIAEMESKTSELQARLAELASRVNEKRALIDQKLNWDKQLRELTSQLEAHPARTEQEADQQLLRLLQDCLRNGLAHPAR